MVLHRPVELARLTGHVAPSTHGTCDIIPGHDEIFRLADMAPDDCCRSARRFTFRCYLVLVAKVE